jgi:hypothetical protein
MALLGRKTIHGRPLPTPEEARGLLPANASRQPFEFEHQFLEIWESAGGRFDGDGLRCSDEVPGAG